MGITFNPKGHFEHRQNCICVDMYAQGAWMEGHDECSGYVVLGDRIPELSCSTGNASHLFALLGFDMGDQGYGELDSATLLAAVGQARRKPLEEYARTAVKSKVEGFGMVYNGELAVERLEYYLDELAAIANYALELDIPVQWA